MEHAAGPCGPRYAVLKASPVAADLSPVSQRSELPDRRRPAQYGRTVVRRIVLRSLAAYGLLLLSPVLFWFVFGLRGSAWIVAELLAISFAVLLDRSVTRILDRRVRGNEAEQQVGAILDRMTDDGWLTLHDVQTGRGNIDHVVVGPGGLLTVETKSYRGRLNVANVDQAWLKQAYAQRKHLERITDIHVDCLLVFSHAYLDRAPWSQRGVMLLPARMLAGHLARRRPVLAPEDVESIYRRLAVTTAI